MATLTHTQLRELWVLAGGPESESDTAAAIAQAESGGCQYALAGPRDIRPVKECTWTRTNRENSCGLWQINLRAHPQYHAPAIFGELANAAAAVSISNGGLDFNPWTTYRTGAYRQFLTAGGTPPPQPGPEQPPSGAAGAAVGLRGYADLRQSVAHHLNRDLYTARKASDAAYRLLGKRTKVGR